MHVCERVEESGGILLLYEGLVQTRKGVGGPRTFLRGQAGLESVRVAATIAESRRRRRFVDEGEAKDKDIQGGKDRTTASSSSSRHSNPTQRTTFPRAHRRRSLFFFFLKSRREEDPRYIYIVRNVLHCVFSIFLFIRESSCRSVSPFRNIPKRLFWRAEI